MPVPVSSLLRVPAPAKLNLFLHLVGRRADGYHLLQSVFTFVDLCDYLDFSLRSDGRIERMGQSVDGLAAEDDLIIRAARLLQQHTGTAFGVNIACEKNIPAGAGLGGGSSDAATTLIALNKLWQTGLNRQQLMDLGLQLGADVPVFIFGRSAFAEGIGEQLQVVKVPNYTYILLKPDVSVATPTIFKDEGLTRDMKPVIITDFTAYEPLADADNSSLDLYGVNVLEPVASRHANEIKSLLAYLHSNKMYARMTGSGSCVFLAFSEKATATRQHEEICSNISQQPLLLKSNLSSWVVDGLASHPLYNWLQA